MVVAEGPPGRPAEGAAKAVTPIEDRRGEVALIGVIFQDRHRAGFVSSQIMAGRRDVGVELALPEFAVSELLVAQLERHREVALQAAVGGVR